jgi:hypothetical protein
MRLSSFLFNAPEYLRLKATSLQALFKMPVRNTLLWQLMEMLKKLSLPVVSWALFLL